MEQLGHWPAPIRDASITDGGCAGYATALPPSRLIGSHGCCLQAAPQRDGRASGRLGGPGGNEERGRPPERVQNAGFQQGESAEPTACLSPGAACSRTEAPIPLLGASSCVMRTARERWSHPSESPSRQIPPFCGCHVQSKPDRPGRMTGPAFPGFCPWLV